MFSTIIVKQSRLDFWLVPLLMKPVAAAAVDGEDDDDDVEEADGDVRCLMLAAIPFRFASSTG